MLAESCFVARECVGPSGFDNMGKSFPISPFFCTKLQPREPVFLASLSLRPIVQICRREGIIVGLNCLLGEGRSKAAAGKVSQGPWCEAQALGT